MSKETTTGIEAEESKNHITAPSSYFRSILREKKDKISNAKEDSKKQLKRSLLLGFLTVALFIGFLSPYADGSNLFSTYITTLPTIAIGFSCLGLILLLATTVYNLTKFYKNKVKIKNLEKEVSSISLDLSILKENKSILPQDLFKDQKLWQKFLKNQNKESDRSL
ncbi:hypothetical protein LBMAG18_03100 [Alphaproteobacteria bacterium]|nr:hypothetical protein LBMAG18_03100 [Alphaproteobacteria bacterium]